MIDADLLGLDWEWGALLLFLALAFLAEVLGTIGGFGSSIFFVPIATFFLGFHEALGLTALFHVASNLSKMYLFRKGFDKRIVLLIGIPAVVAVVAGAFITKLIDTSFMELLLGFLLIGLSIVFFFLPKLTVTPTAGNAVTGGFLSGGLAGLLGTGGAIRGLTLAAFGLSKDVFVATSAFIDLGVDFSRSVVYSTNGFVDATTLRLLPFMIIIGFTGSYLGKIILDRIPQSRFEKIVLMMIFGVGLSMVWMKW